MSNVVGGLIVTTILLFAGTTNADHVIGFPGPVTGHWHRPEPLAIGEFASPVTEGINAVTSEGWAFIESMAPTEREQLLRERVVMVQEEDPDSPSRDEDGDSSAVKGFIRAYVIFDQPKERTVDLMFQPGTLAQYLDDLDASETVRREKHTGELTKFLVEFLWLDIDFWVQHWFYPEHSRYEWFLDKEHFDNSIDENKGFWQLYALTPHKTVGEYGVQVDTGIPIPRRWFERIQRRQIPDAMRQFQRFIDSNGTYRK